MRHERHYTVAQARAARPWVAERLATMRDAREALTDQQVREALADAAPSNGGGDPGTHVGEAFVALRRAAAELTGADIVLRDLDRGLIDFPAMREGEEVYLCWVENEEDDIEYFHGLDDGYGGRLPL
jgi:hypothetical protein